MDGLDSVDPSSDEDWHQYFDQNYHDAPSEILEHALAHHKKASANIIKELVERGIDLYMEDEGRPYLYKLFSDPDKYSFEFILWCYTHPNSSHGTDIKDFPLYKYICHPGDIMLEEIKFFIDNGYDMNKEYERWGGRNILHLMMWHDPMPVQAVLFFIDNVKNFDLNEIDDCGWNALCYAVDRNKFDVFESLLNHGAKVNDNNGYCSCFFETTLLRRWTNNCEYQVEPFVTQLIKRGAKINSIDPIRSTLFRMLKDYIDFDWEKVANHESSYDRMLDVAFQTFKLLVDLGANISEMIGHRTSLQRICEKVTNKTLDFIKVMFEKGESLFVKDQEGRTLIDIIIDGIHKKIVRRFELKELICWLLDKGVHPTGHSLMSLLQTDRYIGEDNAKTVMRLFIDHQAFNFTTEISNQMGKCLAEQYLPDNGSYASKASNESEASEDSEASEASEDSDTSDASEDSDTSESKK